MPTHFIVHDKADTVGVVVVEDVKPGQELTGWVMETDETIGLTSLDAVPLGHKIATSGAATPCSNTAMTSAAPSAISPRGGTSMSRT
ncbi:MAG: hypothetical protein ACLQJR_01315 [Stellaceae bacterium]